MQCTILGVWKDLRTVITFHLLKYTQNTKEPSLFGAVYIVSTILVWAWSMTIIDNNLTISDFSKSLFPGLEKWIVLCTSFDFIGKRLIMCLALVNRLGWQFRMVSNSENNCKYVHLYCSKYFWIRRCLFNLFLAVYFGRVLELELASTLKLSLLLLFSLLPIFLFWMSCLRCSAGQLL